MTKKEERLAALKAAGINTDNFIMEIGKLPAGSEMKIIIGADGTPQIVGVDCNVSTDPILDEIYANGYVKNTKLHRRWVTAQMMDALNYKYYPYKKDFAGRWVRSVTPKETGFDAWLRNTHEYKYQFTMMLNEVYVLSKLQVSDLESFNERSYFFTKEVIIKTCEDYLDKLIDYCSKLKKKKCKGVKYVSLSGNNIFVSDLNKKVFAPCRAAIYRIKTKNDYYSLYLALSSFVNSYVKVYKLPSNTKKCPEWIDAYKGSGSYYTLMNLVKFHEVFITNYKTGDICTGTAAVYLLNSLLDEYQGEGWRYMALLKRAISENDFDLAKSIEAHK